MKELTIFVKKMPYWSYSRFCILNKKRVKEDRLKAIKLFLDKARE